MNHGFFEATVNPRQHDYGDRGAMSAPANALSQVELAQILEALAARIRSSVPPSRPIHIRVHVGDLQVIILQDGP